MKLLTSVTLYIAVAVATQAGAFATDTLQPTATVAVSSTALREADAASTSQSSHNVVVPVPSSSASVLKTPTPAPAPAPTTAESTQEQETSPIANARSSPAAAVKQLQESAPGTSEPSAPTATAEQVREDPQSSDHPSSPPAAAQTQVQGGSSRADGPSSPTGAAPTHVQEDSLNANDNPPPSALSHPAVAPSPSESASVSGPAPPAALNKPAPAPAPAPTPIEPQPSAAANAPPRPNDPKSTPPVGPVVAVPATASSESSPKDPSSASPEKASPSAEANITPKTTADEAAQPTPEPTVAPSRPAGATTADPGNVAPSSESVASAESVSKLPSDQPSGGAPHEASSDASKSGKAQAPTIVPLALASSGSVSFAVGSHTIGLGQTATVGSQRVEIKTNSLGQTWIEYGATAIPSATGLSASATGTGIEHAVSQPASTPLSITRNSKGDVLPGSQTLASEVPSDTITQSVGAVTGQPSTFDTQRLPSSSVLAVIDGHTLTLPSPSPTGPAKLEMISVDGHLVTVSAVASNESGLNGQVLTALSASPTSDVKVAATSVVTFQGQTFEIGGATLAAEPTGYSAAGESLSSKDDNRDKSNAAAPKASLRIWMCTLMGLVVAVAAF